MNNSAVFAEDSFHDDPFHEHATGKLRKAHGKSEESQQHGTVHDEFSWRESNCAESSSVLVKYRSTAF
jgi:hypothetical protein